MHIDPQSGATVIEYEAEAAEPAALDVDQMIAEAMCYQQTGIRWNSLQPQSHAWWLTEARKFRSLPSEHEGSHRAEAAEPAALRNRLAENLTRISDAGRGEWHDRVLPNGAGDSWACVPIGEVIEVMHATLDAIEAEAAEPAALLPRCPECGFMGRKTAHAEGCSQAEPAARTVPFTFDPLTLDEIPGYAEVAARRAAEPATLDVERLVPLLHERKLGCVVTCGERDRHPDASEAMLAQGDEISRMAHYSDAVAILARLQSPDLSPELKDAGDCGGTHHFGLCHSCGVYFAVAP